MWRCFAAEREFASNATWKIHTLEGIRDPAIAGQTLSLSKVVKKASVLKRKKSRKYEFTSMRDDGAASHDNDPNGSDATDRATPTTGIALVPIFLERSSSKQQTITSAGRSRKNGMTRIFPTSTSAAAAAAAITSAPYCAEIIAGEEMDIELEYASNGVATVKK